VGKVAKGCAVTAAGLVLLVGIIFWATSGVTGAADEFVEHLAQGQTNEAYAMFGDKVTSELPREDFDGFLAGTKLGQAESASWGSRSFKNNSGEVSGDINLKDGSHKSVTIYLQKVDDKWLIQGIKFADPSEEETEAELEKCTEVANEFFLQASNGEMEQAYSLCGESMRKDVDMAGLQSLLETSLLTTTSGVKWTDHEPTNLGSKITGVATLANGQKVDLKMTLQEIDGKWLIQGFDYRHQSSGGEVAPPSNQECVAWTKTFLSALATYMDQKDPKPMGEISQSTLRAKLETSDALDGFLQSFPDHAVLRSLLDQPFVFTKTPSQSDESNFKIEGRSEVHADGLYLVFDLEYAVEGDAWKLVNMNLKIQTAAEDKPAPAVEL
jgi:hypothetical protein